MRKRQVVSNLVSIYFDSPLLGHTIKTNCLKLQATDSEIFLIFIFQKRAQEQFLHLFLCIIFQEKYFSCCILLTDHIRCLRLPLLLEILSNMCIAIVYFPGCDVINSFLMKSFFYMTKKSRKISKHLENEKSFKGETKSTFHNF